METYYCPNCRRKLLYYGVVKTPNYTTQYSNLGAGIGILFGLGLGTAAGYAIGNLLGQWVDGDEKTHKWHCDYCEQDYYTKG